MDISHNSSHSSALGQARIYWASSLHRFILMATSPQVYMGLYSETRMLRVHSETKSTTCRTWFFLAPWRLWGLNVGGQASRRVPLAAEPPWKPFHFYLNEVHFFKCGYVLIQLQFPPPTWFTTICNSSSRSSFTFLWPWRALGIHVLYIDTQKQNHSYKQKK